MTYQYTNNEKELIEFRKKFWKRVRDIKKTKQEIPPKTFFGETNLRNAANFELHANGEIDFQISKAYRIAKLYGMTLSDLFNGL